jgi:hypothetical protein
MGRASSPNNQSCALQGCFIGRRLTKIYVGGDVAEPFGFSLKRFTDSALLVSGQ